MRSRTRIAAVVLAVAVSACGGGESAPDARVSEHWLPRAELPMSLQETAAVALDGAVYVIGGMRGSTVVAAVHRYDTADDAWSVAPELPAEVHHANAVVVADTIYVVGHLRTADFITAADVWALQPGTDDAWRVLPPMPRGRGAAAVGVIDGIIHVAGGLRLGRATTLVDAYDPAFDTWTERAPLPVPLDHACGAAIGGTFYVAGGRDGPGGNSAKVFAYTPPDDVWTQVASMPTRRSGVACGVVDGRLIVVGGEGNPDASSGVFPQTEAYDPATDTWETLERMAHPRHGMGAAAWDGRLYVPGGGNRINLSPVRTHDVFVP